MTGFEELLDDIKIFLPKYLSPSQTKELFDSLSAYPNLPNHYLPPFALQDDLLQGDGWHGLVVINFFTLEKRATSGIILSNSCDIDEQNRRATPRSVLFAPLVSLKRYEEAMLARGLTEKQIADTVRDIRAQKVTYIYHLPKEQYGPEESIILLDDIHAHPLQRFLTNQRSLIFRLNQAAFYALLIKLSIHFCRMQEAVRRFPPLPKPPPV